MCRVEGKWALGLRTVCFFFSFKSRGTNWQLDALNGLGSDLIISLRSLSQGMSYGRVSSQTPCQVS